MEREDEITGRLSPLTEKERMDFSMRSSPGIG